MPVIDKIRRNKKEVNADVFKHFTDVYMSGAREVSKYADSVAAMGGPAAVLVKKIYDKIFFSLPSLANSWKNSLIEDELRKDVLLDEEDSESVDINEILDMAAEALADSMDFVSVDTKASEISRKLYSSAGKKAEKEAKKEANKKLIDMSKDVVIKKVDDVAGNSINPDTFELPKDIDIFISKQKMYQDGKHFNKHGRNMGYTNKKEYNEAAINFAEENKSNPNAQVYEGLWNGKGNQNRDVQIIITYDNKSVIINKNSGQIIDFYEGTDFRGLIDLHKVR